MQTYPLAIVALLGISASALAQEIHFQIQTNAPPAGFEDDPDAGYWWDPRFPETAPSHSTSSFRCRIHAPVGAWTRPVLDISMDQSLLDQEPPPAWLTNNPWLAPPSEETQPTFQDLMPQLRNLYGNPSVPDSQIVATEALGLSVPHSASLMRWFDFSLRNGASQPGSTGCLDWCQPVLTPSAGSVTARLWRSSPYWWTENSSISQPIWEGMQNSGAAGTSTYEFFGALRYAVVERALFSGYSAETAAALVNSDDWNDLLQESRIKLSIQAIAILPQPNNGPWGSDQVTPPIFDPSLPLTMVSKASSFHVDPPEENQTDVHGLRIQDLVPGSLHVFHCAEGRHPMEVRFPVTHPNGIPGTLIKTAAAIPSLFGPSQYAVDVPSNLRTDGGVSVRHGEMTDWMVVPN